MNFDSGINHKKWQLLLIPTLSLFASLFVLFSSMNNKTQLYFPWRTFITISVFTYAIWQANLIPYSILDKRMAFYEHPGKRLSAQILSCLVATWVTFTVLYSLVSLVGSGTRARIFNSNYVLFLLVATAISLAINALYVIRYLQATVQYKEALSTQRMNELVAELSKKSEKKEGTQYISEPAGKRAAAKQNSLVVGSGNKIQSIHVSAIAYWYSSDGIVTLVLDDGKKITTNFSSYTDFIELLPEELFFQLSRQFVAHIQSIHSIRDDVNRKLLVELKTKSPGSKIETVIVSRYRSQQLKSWFAQSTQFNQ